MIKKIIFLFKSETNIKIILLFLFQKIIKIFIKNKIKKEKVFFLELVSKLRISKEFFSVNAYNFYKHLSSLKNNFKYLEIGSFEGGSEIFVSNRFKESKIFCVDNWLKTEDGYNYSKRCALSIVAQAKKACNGDLSKIKSCIKLTGFVNSTDDFVEQPKVINGASDMIVSIFGDIGMHTRAAVSTNSLPLGVAVEVDAIFEIK